MWFASVLLGAFFASTATQERIENKLKSLNYDQVKGLPTTDRKAFASEENGLNLTIGNIPNNFPALQFNSGCDLQDIFKHLPRELSRDNFIHLFGIYLSVNEKLSQSYRALIDKIIKTYLQDSYVNMPAGIDKHKGRSLLTHNILVCALMLHRANDYEYKPIGVKPIDTNYKINPDDPILLTVGIAHDIGKIICLEFDSNNNPIGMKENHAQNGCRIVTAMPEFWNLGIPVEERKIIQNILAFYHSPNMLPVAKAEDTRPTVTSDRQQAIINLLVECDILASSIEYGTTYSFTQKPTQIIQTAPIEIEELRIEEEFLAFIISGSASINAANGIKSDIFRFKGLLDGKESDVLIFDEAMFLEKFSTFIKNEQFKNKVGKNSELTGRVLEALDAQNILLRAPNELGERKARNCLYKITFVSPDEAREPLLVINSAFIVDLGSYTEAKVLSDISSCKFIPTIDNSIFGNQGQRTFKTVAKIEDRKLLSDDAPKLTKTVADISKRVKKSQFSPDSFFISVKKGLANGTLKPVTVSENPNNDVIILGSNEFFKRLGITPDNALEHADSFEKIGVKEFKWSKSSPELFLVILDSNVYAE